MRSLSPRERRRFEKRAVGCALVHEAIESLSDFFAVIDSVVTSQANFWFRGHSRIDWSLMPSALRYKAVARRNQALELLARISDLAPLTARVYTLTRRSATISPPERGGG